MRLSDLPNCTRTKANTCYCENISLKEDTEQVVTATSVLVHSDKVKGKFLFKQKSGGPTMIVGQVTGLAPGLHGFHIHEFGD